MGGGFACWTKSVKHGKSYLSTIPKCSVVAMQTCSRSNGGTTLNLIKRYLLLDIPDLSMVINATLT